MFGPAQFSIPGRHGGHGAGKAVFANMGLGGEGPGTAEEEEGAVERPKAGDEKTKQEEHEGGTGTDTEGIRSWT